MEYYIDLDENCFFYKHIDPETTELDVKLWYKRKTKTVNFKPFHLDVLPKLKNLSIWCIHLNKFSLEGISFDSIPLKQLCIFFEFTS